MNKLDTLLNHLTKLLTAKCATKPITCSEQELLNAANKAADFLVSWVTANPTNIPKTKLNRKFFTTGRRKLLKPDANYQGSTQLYHLYQASPYITTYILKKDLTLTYVDSQQNLIRLDETEYQGALLDPIDAIQDRKLNYFDTKPFRHIMGHTLQKMHFVECDSEFNPIKLVLNQEKTFNAKILIHYHLVWQIMLIAEYEELFKTILDDYIIVGNDRIGFIINKNALYHIPL